MDNQLLKLFEALARKHGLHRNWRRKHRPDGSPYTKPSRHQRAAKQRRKNKAAKVARRRNR